MDGERRSVSLALGGGGARGLAHIGVIEWLEAHGFEIRAIAGASMGALVGGIYAAGKLDVYTGWVTALERRDVVRLIDLSFGHSGLIKGERVIEVLRELIGDRDIQDLPVEFTAVATDLDAQKEVWFSRGPLFDAIRASIAYPTLFTPVVHEGRTLVDGGLVNPLPIAPTLHAGTALTIAVNLNARARGQVEVTGEPEERGRDGAGYRARITQFVDGLQRALGTGAVRHDPGFLQVINRSIETMQGAITRCKLAAYSPDAIVDIPRDACAVLDFHRARDLIALGRRCAAEALAPLAQAQPERDEEREPPS